MGCLCFHLPKRRLSGSDSTTNGLRRRDLTLPRVAGGSTLPRLFVFRAASGPDIRIAYPAVEGWAFARSVCGKRAADGRFDRRLGHESFLLPPIIWQYFRGAPARPVGVCDAVAYGPRPG